MQEANKILSDLKQKKYFPLYFLYGTESLYIDKICDYIEQNVLSESEKAFNLSVLYGRDIDDSNKVIEACSRLPMMANQQVVIIKEAQDLKNFAHLENYFKNPVKSTILVFAYKHKKVDKRKTVFKNLLKNKDCVSLESNTIRDYEVSRWISNYCQTQKINIEPKGVELLSEFLGTDLAKITHEIDKLILLKGKEKTITSVAIEENIGISKEYNIFELNNALGERNQLKCYRIVNYFIANPKNLFLPMAIGTIYSFFTKLLLAKYANTTDRSTLGSILRLNPFIAQNYAQYASNYNVLQIKNTFNILKEYDLKSKGMGMTGATSQGEILKEMTIKILN